MTSRVTEIYTCDGCGRTADGLDTEGTGPKGWLALSSDTEPGITQRCGDFCSETCCLLWIARRLGPKEEGA